MHKTALNRSQYISVLKLVAEGKKRFDWLRINVLRILLCWNPSDQVSQWVFFLLPATEMALSSSAQHWTVAAGTVLALSQSLFWWFLSGIKVSSEDFWETFCSFCAFWTVKEWLRKWSLRNFLAQGPKQSAGTCTIEIPLGLGRRRKIAIPDAALRWVVAANVLWVFRFAEEQWGAAIYRHL